VQNAAHEDLVAGVEADRNLDLLARQPFHGRDGDARLHRRRLGRGRRERRRLRLRQGRPPPEQEKGKEQTLRSRRLHLPVDTRGETLHHREPPRQLGGCGRETARGGSC
jgi:hypothetical protein